MSNQSHPEPPILALPQGCIYELRLNRPHRLNGFTDALARALLSHVESAERDPDIRVLLITANGGVFSCGMDLDDLLQDGHEAVDIRGVLETLYNPLIRKLVTTRFPVVVALNGVAAGGAAGLVLAADFVIAAEDAKLISAFSKIGLIPDCGVSWAAVRKLGYARAMSFSLLERTIEAREGAALGLFCDVVPPVELRQRAIALSKDLAAASATSASLTKAALNAALCAPLDTQLETEKNLQGDAFGASDFLEGVKAFYEKRSPKF